MAAKKRDLDRRVAILLGLPVNAVSLVTEAFLNETRKAITKERDVNLDGLGSFHLYAQQGSSLTTLLGEEGRLITRRVIKKYYVRFSKAGPLRDAIRAKWGRPSKKENEHGEVFRRRTGSGAGEAGE